MTIQTSKNLILAKKASAMLIAMGFAFVLILFGMGATKLVIRALKEATHFEESEEAFFAAEAGLEKGLLAAKENDAGYVVPRTNISYASFNGSEADYELRARGTYIDPADTTNFYIPPQGWGTAGIDCDTIHPETRDNSDDVGDACNWGRLRVGESVEIPLYYDERGSIQNPADMGLTLLQVKIRPACETYNSDWECTSWYDLDTDFDDIVIVNWEISGECEDSGGNQWTCTMVPLVSVVASDDSQIKGREIREGTPSSGGEPIVLAVENSGNLGDDINSDLNDAIYYFIKDISPWEFREIDSPKLKLHFITPIYDDSTPSEPIPYLEYQIVTDREIGTPHNYIISEGFSGDFKQSLQIIQKLDTTVLDFVIQN